MALIPSGCGITVGGFVGSGCPELLLNALRRRFDATRQPSGLKLLLPVSSGDRQGRGVDALAAPGLLSELVYGWMGTAPALMQMVQQNQLLAWNLPLGAVSHMLRDLAARRAGPVTHVGLGTFVDPRQGGGASNSRTRQQDQQRVKLVTLPGRSREMLWYPTPAEGVRVALLRGTVADHCGNISCEGEAMLGDGYSQAAAAHNWCAPRGNLEGGTSGRGLVIVQVLRLLPPGQVLPPGRVTIPGILVDCVVLAPPQLHLQTFADAEPDPSLCSRFSAAGPGQELKQLAAAPWQAAAAAQQWASPQPTAAAAPAPAASAHSQQAAPPQPATPAVQQPAAPAHALGCPRRIMAHRALQEIDQPGGVVALGGGSPADVAPVLAAHPHLHPLAAAATFTTEAGVIGGSPQVKLRFGSCRQPRAFTWMGSMLDLYHGGLAAVGLLGLAQVDRWGNVNASSFGPGRRPGCGGFVDISQSVRKVVFVGTFTSGGLQVQVGGGQLRVLQEGAHRKFVQQVLERTFSAAHAGHDQEVIYITERAVFRLQRKAACLACVAASASNSSSACPRSSSSSGGGSSSCSGGADSGGYGSQRPGHLQQGQLCCSSAPAGSIREAECCCSWLELLEVAPGVDVQRQVLDLMDFVPQVPPGGPQLMGPAHAFSAL